LATLTVLIGHAHIVFLGALLPGVLRDDLGIAAHQALDAAGGLTFAAGLAVAAGSLAAPRVAARLGPGRAMPVLMLASSACLAFLPAMRDLASFASMRILQVLLVSPVITLAVVDVARIQFGQGLALLSAARNLASFLAPVAATLLALALGTGAVDRILAAAGAVTAGLLALGALVPVAQRVRVAGARRGGRAG
ncbi:MAG TPA: hypothetical protein VFX28_13805, partial [Methylomirabilota bacterium]|nr:hypothetical protein [Methylomirabilota bacterium]